MVFKSLFTSRILPSPIQYEVEAPNIKLIKVVLQGRRGGQGFAPTPLLPQPRNPWATEGLEELSVEAGDQTPSSNTVLGLQQGHSLWVTAEEL